MISDIMIWYRMLWYVELYILCVRAQTRCSDPNVRVRCHTRMDYIWLDTIRCGIGTPWGADLWFGGFTKYPATINGSTNLTGLRHIPPGKMAQLPCSGLSWPLTKPPFGSCTIYFHQGISIWGQSNANVSVRNHFACNCNPETTSPPF